MNWLDAREANGMGWLSDCGNYSIRQCIYNDGSPTDYWCYYRPEPDHKFMPMYGGTKSTLEFAKQHVDEFIKAHKAISAIREIDSHIADQLKKELS